LTEKGIYRRLDTRTDSRRETRTSPKIRDTDIKHKKKPARTGYKRGAPRTKTTVRESQRQQICTGTSTTGRKK
jgi:hypothetical protein